MKALYTIVIILFTWMVQLAALFNHKAWLWVKGRKKWRKKLKEGISGQGKTFWIHCASLGEFEQGRPVIEMIKKLTPEIKILVTFFSPSGYEIRKDWPLADYICYLPADTRRNASVFIDIVKPSMVIFIKYEFWANYISEIRKQEIPLYLVSSIFRADQHFFRWYGGFSRKILKNFTHIFVQDESSMQLLQSIKIKDVTISGDTRFDRVARIMESPENIPQIEKFRKGEKLFLAGSSWKADEEIITRYINKYPGRMKWIFAPHEIDDSNIGRLERLLNVSYLRFSRFNEASADARVLIMDNIGMLAKAYRYACISAIGGGFGDGIHSILEPACWGIPILFGPNHLKFREAADLISENGAFTFRNYEEFEKILDRLIEDETEYRRASKATSDYVRINTGATQKIVELVLHSSFKDISSVDRSLSKGSGE